MLDMEVKFFPRDVRGGKASQPGDKFQAEFLGSTVDFEVTTHHGEWFMAKLAEVEQ